MLTRNDEQGERIDQIRLAISEHRKMHIAYQNENEERCERDLRPLGLHFWGRCWTLAAWCELRNDFLMFRLDRIQSAAVLALKFRDEPGRTLNDFLRTVGAQA